MGRLTLRQLEILDAVARNGNFSRAGVDLHLSQPAVSMQIKQLEAELGLPLFEHVGKRIQLTEAGQEALRTAHAIERELANLEQTLAYLQGLEGGTLTVSAASTASVFSARLMALFRTLHPDVRVCLNVVNRESLLQQLTGNNIDLALMGQPPEGLGLVARHFMDNPLVVIAATSHPLAETYEIPLSRFLDEPLVGREQGSGTRGALEKFLAEHGLSYSAAMEMNKNEAIKQAVEAGLGLGVVSLHTIQAELVAGQLCVLDVKGFPLMRQWYIVQRAGKRLSPPAHAFTQLVLNEAARLTR
jgi:LysR family transcriptional regulator, low CO2-responsive transcriptional regulator